jgi:dihydropyrimidinase
VVSTDHCAFKWQGQKTLGWDDFSKIPNGGPGIEDRLNMLHHFGVRKGRFSLNRLVQLVSTNPARTFGLYPRKGTIAIGSDADIVIFNPERKLTLSAASHHSRVDYNLYEGTEVEGAPETVLVRGQVIIEDRQLVAEPGAGRFVRRARVSPPLAGGVPGGAGGGGPRSTC